jgi:hypothetical protein
VKILLQKELGKKNHNNRFSATNINDYTIALFGGFTGKDRIKDLYFLNFKE